MSKDLLKVSEEWQRLRPSPMVYDPDGWDRMNFQYSWYEELITEEEYTNRMLESTCMFKVDGKLNWLDKLAEQCLNKCRLHKWSRDWKHLGVYLHLETSEYIEAIRGKKGDSVDEAADILFVLFSSLAHEHISVIDVIEKLTVNLLEDIDVEKAI